MGLAANSYSQSPTVATLKTFLTTGIKTVALIDCGIVQQVTATAHIITLPATAAALVFTVSNGGADGACAPRIQPNAVDQISGGGFTPVDNKYIENTLATAKKGDFVTLLGDAGAGYIVTAMKGIWARQP